MDILSTITSFNDNKKQLNDFKSQLGKQLSTIDCHISNLYHILEISPLNAVQFTKISYKLKEALITRRKIKEDTIMIDGCLKDNKSVSTLQKESIARLEKYERQCKQSLTNLI